MRINLATPIGGQWEGRGFGRRYVWRYECGAGHTVRVRCNAWRGKTPDTGIGAIECPHCPPVVLTGQGDYAKGWPAE